MRVWGVRVWGSRVFWGWRLRGFGVFGIPIIIILFFYCFFWGGGGGLYMVVKGIYRLWWFEVQGVGCKAQGSRCCFHPKPKTLNPNP